MRDTLSKTAYCALQTCWLPDGTDNCYKTATCAVPPNRQNLFKTLSNLHNSNPIWLVKAIRLLWLQKQTKSNHWRQSKPKQGATDFIYWKRLSLLLFVGIDTFTYFAQEVILSIFVTNGHIGQLAYFRNAYCWCSLFIICLHNSQ